ncbi:MAG: ATP-dependent helicase [bacterium]
MRQYTLKSERPPARAGFLADLNPEQRVVAESLNGPLLVIAGAGTGKTRTLTYRAANLVENGVDPGRLLLLTFTNKAAREMTDRVMRLVPRAAGRIWAGTFHAIGNRILREQAERLGYGLNYGILDSEESRDVMDMALAEAVPDTTKQRFPKAAVLQSMVSSSVNTERSLEAVIKADFPQFIGIAPAIEQVGVTYMRLKADMNVMDYDDLLVNWRMLLEDHADLRAAYQARFSHILVDEYQDTNRLQAAVVRLMGAHGNVMVVGDDCQSIYAFRGAELRNILDFPALFEGTRITRLETSYRSTPQVLAVANGSIRHNRRQFDKTLRAHRGDGELPIYACLSDAQQQAAFVSQRVLELRDEGVELKQQAVLYRAHYQAMELQLELQRRGIPFVIRSGTKFFEQGHIRDLLAHLKILFNPLDRLAWTRVLKLYDGVGNQSAATIYQHLAGTGDPWAALVAGAPIPKLPGKARKSFEQARALLLDLGAPHLVGDPASMLELVLDRGYQTYLDRVYPNADQRGEDVRQLAHHASQYPDYRAFLEELALVESVSVEEIQSGSTSDECLVLSTIHQAKGLEWDAVYVLHLADGHFPLQRAMRTPDEIEEERRLFYVAVTRARHTLHLCHPQWSTGRDRFPVLHRPSRFLEELPHTRGDLIETWRIAEDL